MGESLNWKLSSLRHYFGVIFVIFLVVFSLQVLNKENLSLLLKRGGRLRWVLAYNASSYSNSDVNFSEIQKLPPNHSRVLEYIFKNHIYPPSLQPYNCLSNKNNIDPSAHRELVSRRIGTRRNGFFVEVGANDGEFYSNTLQLERNLGWSGLLIEAHPGLSKILLEKNRKAWFANLCLSPYYNISEMTFEFPELQKYSWQVGGGKVKMRDDIEKVKPVPGEILYFRTVGQVKCFPLDSVLKALNITHIDFFSLDVQGVELKILKTLPWDGSLTIDHLLIEYELLPERKEALRSFMSSKGYQVVVDTRNDFLLRRNNLTSTI